MHNPPSLSLAPTWEVPWGGPGWSGGLQGRGINWREIQESKRDCFGDKPQLSREVTEEPRLHAGSPILLGSEGEGSPDPLRVPAGNEEPLPTAWLLPNRWSWAGLQTGGIQAIWSHARRRRRWRRRWRQQLEPGSALPPNPLAHCTRGIRAPPAPCQPRQPKQGGGTGAMLGTAGDQHNRSQCHPVVLLYLQGFLRGVGGRAAAWGN